MERHTKAAKENSFLRVRLLLKDELIRTLNLLSVLDNSNIISEGLEKNYEILNKRNNNTIHLDKITDSR